MDRKKAIHSLLEIMAFELLGYIKEAELDFDDRWVPAADIKRDLELNFIVVPKESDQQDPKGWLFAILARLLEDQGLLEYQKEGCRAFYRTKAA